MPAMSYLFAVQRETGHEVAVAIIETSRVSDVHARYGGDGRVELVHDGDVVAASPDPIPTGEALTLHRWPAGDKLTEPVSKPVSRDDS